jgi:hypothetical protein
LNPGHRTITLLAGELLDGGELKLSLRISQVLGDPTLDAFALISDILPKYSERKEGRLLSLSPRSVYRPLFYVADYAGKTHFEEHSRIFIDNACSHIEGCLLWLTRSSVKYESPQVPFGPLVYKLWKDGRITKELAGQLLKFNEVVNVPSKHQTVQDFLGLSLEERSFSVLDAALSFVMMRKLSMQLFAILKQNGVTLPGEWKEFKEEWLSWDRRVRTI